MSYFDDNVRTMLYQAPQPVQAEAVARMLWTRAELVTAALERLAVQGLVQRLADGRWTAAGPAPDATPPPSAAGAGRPPRAETEAELARLRAELGALRRERDQLRSALAMARAAARGPGPRGGGAELHDWVGDLLVLCHPDRHDNSDRANRVTRWLLGQRRR